MQKKTSSPGSRIVIKGEGCDEWQNRYFKFAVRGIKTDIPPFSAEDIIKDKDQIFVELINAGTSGFRPSARTELLDRLDKRKVTAPKFKVVTRLGWNSGAFVLPGNIVGEPTKQLEPSFRHLDPQLLAKYRSSGTLRPSYFLTIRNAPGAMTPTARRPFLISHLI